MTNYQYASGRNVSGRLALRRTASPGTSKSVLSVTPDAWKRAYQFSLANAAIFVGLSWALFFIEPSSLSAILCAPALFFAGAMTSFVLLVRSGGAFAAIAWFILGGGVYFGLGVFIGGVAPDPRSIHYGSESVLLSDLLRINVLNSSSVALVLVTGLPLAYRPRSARAPNAPNQPTMNALLLKLFPPMAVLALFAIGIQFIIFPIATNLIVRSLFSSVYFIVPFFLLALGMLWTRLEFTWAAVGVLVLLLAFALSLLAMSKFALMSTVVAFVVGIWVHRRSLRSVAGGLLVLGAIYAYTGALVNEGRAHFDYDAAANSPLSRVGILVDVIVGNSRENQAGPSGPMSDVTVPATIRRFSVTDIQAYLMDQYDHQQPGTSLNDFWVAAVPRILWPDKPIVTRFGAELHQQYWAAADSTSALAPTYTAEAYWNYGPLGLVIVSILIGLEIGWLTQRWHIATRGLDLAFFVIAFPTALWASFVETWIAATYVGGFITIVMLWCFSRVVLLKLFVGELPRGLGRPKWVPRTTVRRNEVKPGLQ